MLLHMVSYDFYNTMFSTEYDKDIFGICNSQAKFVSDARNGNPVCKSYSLRILKKGFTEDIFENIKQLANSINSYNLPPCEIYMIS